MGLLAFHEHGGMTRLHKHARLPHPNSFETSAFDLLSCTGCRSARNASLIEQIGLCRVWPHGQDVPLQQPMTIMSDSRDVFFSHGVQSEPVLFKHCLLS